ncbi:MAG TPA: glutamate dehydrogenase, partial [Pseudomonadales bacterium]|nr:glutamate dehydrogenase [Pseudomonadales bacterium]
MAWVKDEIGRSVGLPEALGGIPLDELGATGYGIAAAAEVAQDFCDVKLNGATVAIQGFGSVGMHSAKFLARSGTILVAAADSKGTVYDPDGLDVEALIELKHGGGSVMDYPRGKKLSAPDIVSIPCDIWIPAARPDVITKDNVASMQTRLILQGANIPATAEAESALHAAGILCLPDFIVNAGGVICAAMEYQGLGEAIAFDTIRAKVAANTRIVLQEAKQSGKLPREAAIDLARQRVTAAMGTRRFSLY